MQEIQAKSQSVRELLGQKYTVDSYQREYKWVDKQVDDLLDDLFTAFNEHHKEGDGLSDVKKYGHYFLGPIIVNTGGDHNYVVDGQQRLTTLTLALICLLRMTENKKQTVALSNLIYSEDYGTKSFNLDVPDRNACLLCLYNGEEFDVTDESESVRNLVERYKQMQNNLVADLTSEQIPLFTTWLIQKVHLVAINASSDSDAYKIFETMNDRGLRLTPAEMLKGYLLSAIGEERAREEVNKIWKKVMDKLTERKGEDSDAIKSWLRARHAEKIADFDDIGSQFHRWVRENDTLLSLKSSDDFAKFITSDFVFYANQYFILRRAAEKFNPADGLERVHYLAQHSFTLQYPLLLAALSPNDSPQEIKSKLRVVATYLDILVHRRIGHWASIAESFMRNRIFGLVPQLRNKTAIEVADLLVNELANTEFEETFNADFRLHGNNRPRIHRVLARITDYIETESKLPSHYADYFAPGKKSFQIEHIWHNNYEEVCAEESIDPSKLGGREFDTSRNNIGGLLLLPSSDNTSYGDIPYAVKREYYAQQNLLASSLHEGCYKAKIGFRQFVDKSELPFVSYKKFDHKALQKRQDLYRKIADQIWHPNRIHEALT